MWGSRGMFKTHYKRLKLLGEGSFGSAFLVRERVDENGYHVAKEIKVDHLSEKEREAALEESSLLRRLSHPNVVAYRATFREGPKLYIIMEFADNGDLATKIKEKKEESSNFSERRIMLFFVQIAQALVHIHAHKILHRDLKPMNIFLTKTGVVKLGDFGIARVLESSTAGAKTQIGTPYYLSPEVCSSEQYGLKSDHWSLGVITYQLAALRVPFYAACVPAVAVAICNATPAPLPKMYSDGFKYIVSRLLQKDPTERPGLGDILRAPYAQTFLQILDPCTPSSCRRNSETEIFEQRASDRHESRNEFQMDYRDFAGSRRSDQIEHCDRVSDLLPHEGGETPGYSRRRRDDEYREGDRERRRRYHDSQEDGHERLKQAARDDYFRNREIANEARRRAQANGSRMVDHLAQDELSYSVTGESCIALAEANDTFPGSSTPLTRRTDSVLSQESPMGKREEHLLALERARAEVQEDRKRTLERIRARETGSFLHSEAGDTIYPNGSTPRRRTESDFSQESPTKKEQHLLALERARIEAQEDRRLALERVRAREAEAADTLENPVADFAGSADMTPRTLKITSEGGPACSPKCSQEDQLAALERARREAYLERMALKEKYGRNPNQLEFRENNHLDGPPAGEAASPAAAASPGGDRRAAAAAATASRKSEEEHLRALNEARIEAQKDRQRMKELVQARQSEQESLDAVVEQPVTPRCEESERDAPLQRRRKSKEEHLDDLEQARREHQEECQRLQAKYGRKCSKSDCESATEEGEHRSAAAEDKQALQRKAQDDFERNCQAAREAKLRVEAQVLGQDTPKQRSVPENRWARHARAKNGARDEQPGPTPRHDDECAGREAHRPPQPAWQEATLEPATIRLEGDPARREACAEARPAARRPPEAARQGDQTSPSAPASDADSTQDLARLLLSAEVAAAEESPPRAASWTNVSRTDSPPGSGDERNLAREYARARERRSRFGRAERQFVAEDEHLEGEKLEEATRKFTGSPPSHGVYSRAHPGGPPPGEELSC